MCAIHNVLAIRVSYRRIQWVAFLSPNFGRLTDLTQQITQFALTFDNLRQFIHQSCDMHTATVRQITIEISLVPKCDTAVVCYTRERLSLSCNKICCQTAMTADSSNDTYFRHCPSRQKCIFKTRTLPRFSNSKLAYSQLITPTNLPPPHPYLNTHILHNQTHLLEPTTHQPHLPPTHPSVHAAQPPHHQSCIDADAKSAHKPPY